MTTVISRQFSFGEDDAFFYNFNVHIYHVPGGTNVISTIVLASTNMTNQGKDKIDPYLQDLILFLANLVIEYNANYDSFQNQLDPFSFEECDAITDQVMEKVTEIKSNLSSEP